MRSTFRRSSALVLMTALGLLGAAGCGPHIEPADLVLTNGHVVTVDAARPTAEGVAVRGGKIVAVGSVADIKALETMNNSPFHRDREKPGPCAFRGSACDNGVKLLSYF